jgi:uncharacterized protein
VRATGGTTLDPPRRRRSLRLSVYLAENDRVGHRPCYTELVHRAAAQGLAGASVFRGYEGFGHGHRVHTTRLLSLADDLPVLVVMVDAPERIRAFLPVVREVAPHAMAVVEDVELLAPEHP